MTVAGSLNSHSSLFLTFSRLDAGEEKVEVEAFQLGLLVAEVRALMEPLALSKGLGFACEAPADVPAIRTDARKLRQILINLCGNAVKYTRPTAAPRSAEY